MRSWLVVLFVLFSNTALGSPLDQARAEDAALRQDEGRLRLRHNVEHLIELWRAAEEAATNTDERIEAARGQAEAWALLAHWSGAPSDLKRAAEEQLRVTRMAPHTLRAVRVEGGTISFDATGDYAIESGTFGEHRLYFELHPLAAVREVLGELKLESDEIDRARVTQFDADTVRVVVDFRNQIAPHEIGRGEVRLKLSTLDARRSIRSGKLSAIVAEVKAAYADAADEAQNDPPKPRRSLLAIRKVVIDAGHGGKDQGARGKALLEKDVNLQIALKVGAELERAGVKVVYTRKSDRFVSLEKRTAIANRSGADLFISIHANANRSQRIHGIETYFLDTSSNRYASRLARRENGQDDPPDLDPEEEEDAAPELTDGALGRDLRLILADLAMRSATSESKRLAGYVQSSMIGSVRKEFGQVKDLGVKHALFAVLIGVRMPSVLIETGFVTHPAESQRLANAPYQAKVAKAIASAVQRYVEERERLAVNVR